MSVGVLGVAIGGAAVWFGLHDGAEGANPAPMPRETHEPRIETSTAVPAHRRSLVEIGLNPHDFQRNTALLALLADTGSGDVEALLAEAEALDPSPHRYDVVRVIYTRFAEIDPEAAADHVVAANYHSSWVAAVFRAWAHTDLDAAVDRAATLEDDAKAIAAATILELDLSLRQREDIASQLDSEMALAAINTRSALVGADQDFAAAWQSVLRGVDTSREPRSASDMAGMLSTFSQVGVFAQRWADHDPAAAMAAIDSLGNQVTETMARSAVFEVWAKDDPTGAIAWLSEAEHVRNRDSLVRDLMCELVQDGLGEAIVSLDTLPDNLQEAARVGLVRALQRGASGDLDFQIVLDWYDTLESPSDGLGRELAQAYAARNPEQALAWAQTLNGRAQRDAVGRAVSQLARSDPALTKRLIAEIESPLLRQRAAERFVATAARNDPEETLRWARSFPDEDGRGQLVQRTLATWSRESPREATLELLAMRDAELRDQVAPIIAWTIADRGHADLAEELFEAVESEDARRSVAGSLLQYYTQVDPDEDKAEFYRGIAPERMRRRRND